MKTMRFIRLGADKTNGTIEFFSEPVTNSITNDPTLAVPTECIPRGRFEQVQLDFNSSICSVP